MIYIMYIIYLQYILYNSRRCARKKCAQRRCIYHFPASYGSETSQGVQWDSLGVGAIKIGRIFAPDRRRHRQEAPKRFLATPASFPCFLCRFSAAWGGLGLYLFVPCTALALGGLKGQETRRWFLTTRVFWHFPCLWRERGCVAA